MNNILIEQIKNANDIVDVIGERMTLKKAGVNYTAVCPFHADTTPSLTISRQKQIYKCFACGAGGDVIKFVQEYDKVSFYEAIKYLADRVRIEMPKDMAESSEDKENRIKRDAALTAMRAAQAEFLSGCSSQEYFAYLSQRGISQDTAAKFGLGYCASGFFGGRITYPFYDLTGNVIGFTGRAIEWSKESEYPKYKNSAENVIFHKERAIFGLQQAKRAIADKGNVYWVEGQNDVLSLSQRGIENVVCGSGTAFTESHAKILSRFSNTVTLLFDGDTAGRNAILKAVKILLRVGVKINVVLLPDGEDPDTFSQIKFENIEIEFNKRLFRWNEYLLKCYPCEEHEADKNSENIKILLEYASEIKEEIRRSEFIKTICLEYGMGADMIRKQLKPIPKTDTWQNGYYGLHEAQEVIENYGGDFRLTFDEKKFIDAVGDIPVILWKGEPLKHIIQSLRSNVSQLYINSCEIECVGFKEPYTLQVLSELHKEHIQIYVEDGNNKRLFVDYYVNQIADCYDSFQASEAPDIVRRALDLIAHTDATVRTMMSKEWSRSLKLGVGEYNKLIKELVAKITADSAFEKQNSLYDDHSADFDPYELPDYVKENKEMLKIYNVEGYFPLLRKDGEPCAYVFRNEKGDGHSILSDFFIKPLLHIYSKEKSENKRIFQLIKRNGAKSEYVEWASSTVTTLNSIDDQLVNQGAYTLKCTAYQYKSIRTQLLNGCVSCSVFNTYGWQPQGFWAFPNAIYHTVKSEQGEATNKIDYTDRLGTVEHNGSIFYSPACSEIYIRTNSDERNSQYVTDRLCIYREIPQEDRINFAEWARLMNEVHKINDNGKWAVLFDIMMCFRDYIHSKTLFFTTLFFIGKTGSGKSQIAESVRSLFMPPNAPSYNLNNVSLPAMNLVLERYCNMPVIFEEYNDGSIQDAIFQSLKSAVYDGEGRSKLGGSNFKSLETSVINAIPILLGQEAPQKDDGSLANRSILCDVPGKVDGAYTREEIEIFNRLKRHEKIGLSNVLLEILNIRPVVLQYFLSTYDVEKQKLTDYVSSKIKSSDGLSRTIETISLFTTICKIVEKYTQLQLPFTYEEFFQMATAKVVKQVEAVSTTNKISAYFQTMQFLLANNKLVRGKEFKVVYPRQLKVKKLGSRDYEPYEVAPEQRVLFINFSLVYNAYRLVEGKEALSKQSLINYFESNAAYIGHVKNTKYKYYEDESIEEEDAFGQMVIKRVSKKRESVNSAYVFDYDMIAQLMDIDLLQGAELEEE